MNSSSKAEMKANPVLKTWNSIASQTCKPFECAFSMLNNRFTVLKECTKLCYEDDISYFCLPCLLPHNLCINMADIEDHYLPQDDSDEDKFVTVETSKGKKQYDALLYYAIEILGKM